MSIPKKNMASRSFIPFRHFQLHAASSHAPLPPYMQPPRQQQPLVVLLWVTTRACAKALCHKIRVGFSDLILDEYLVVITVERCCKTTSLIHFRFTTLTYMPALQSMHRTLRCMCVACVRGFAEWDSRRSQKYGHKSKLRFSRMLRIVRQGSLMQ